MKTRKVILMNGTNLQKQILPVATHSNGRAGHKVTKIVVHHMAGNLSLQQCKNVFNSRKSSATYAIDVNGNIGQYVDEKDRPWTTSGADPDNYCITIELANDNLKTWHISDVTINACVKLCADICKRYGITKLYYDGKKGTLLRHCDYSATACPGNYFKSITNEFCNSVNALINENAQKTSGNGANSSETASDGKLYRVQTGAFKSKENAQKYAEELNKKGIKTVIKEG